MNNEERGILKKLVEHSKGSLSPCEMINVVARRDNRSVSNLIATGYIEEVETHKNDKVYTFYRASAKALLFFDKWYKRMWYSLKGDIRNIIVSAITAIVIYYLMEFL